jgi:hypothetical protein
MEIIFTLIIVMLVIADLKLYRTIFTPFSLIASIYLVLILLNNFVAVHLGFFQIENLSILYILYFLFLIYIISVIFYFLFKKNKFKPEYNAELYIRKNVSRYKKLIILIFFIGLVSRYLSLYSAISLYGFSNIKGNAFGLLTHLGNFGLVLTPFIMVFYIESKKIKYLIFILLMYINLLLFGGKYGIVIAVFHSIIFYSMINKTNTRKTLKTLLLMIAIGVSIFIIIYAVIPGYTDINSNSTIFIDRLMFSFRHLLFYLVSPVVATNHYFINSGLGNIETLFTVPINIVKAILSTGNYVNPVNPVFIPVHSYYTTNVGGLFAESVFQSNFIIASIYIAVFFLFVYFIFNLSRYRGKMISLSALLLSIVSMMFFGNLLTVSGVFLQIIFLLIIEIMLMKRVVLKKKI